MKFRDISFLAALVAVPLTTQVILGQVRVTKTRVERTADGRLRVIPDPNNKWDCLFFLIAERSAQKDLELTQEARLAIQEVEEDLKRQEREVAAYARDSGEDVYQQVMKFRSTAAKRFFDEVLTPDQQQRLPKLIYRIEIQRMGLGDSITDGRLAETIGVHDNQKDLLKRTAAKIEQTTREKIATLLSNAEKELFSHLTPEQRDRAEELVGDTAGYLEPTRYQSAYARVKEEIEDGDDPFAIVPSANRLPSHDSKADKSN